MNQTASATMTSDLIPDDDYSPSEDEKILAIPIRLIDIPEDWRYIPDKDVVDMADSILEIGMIQPIGVVAGTKGRFTLCFGRTRLLATQLLKRRTIKARVLVVENDEHRQVITDVENIRRTKLQPAEEVRAIGRWRDWYVKKHPESSLSTDQFKVHTRPVAESESDSESDPEPTPAPDKAPGFTRQATGRIGQSERTIKYSLKIRKKIPDEYLQEFAKRNVSRTDLLKIASIEPEEDRLGVCNLFGFLGVPLEEAIMDVTAPPGVHVEHRQSRSIPADIPPVQEVREEDISDDDWYKLRCRDVTKRLTDPSRYKADAILYRQVRDARDEFRAKTKRALSQGKSAYRGAFHYAMCRAVNIDHPSTWLICGACDGTGQSRPNMNSCQTCHGGGYLLTTISVKREK